MGGEDRFGMELDPPERKGAVTESHDFAFGCLCGDFQAVGQTLTAYEQAVVSGRLEGIGKPLKEILGVMKDRGGLPVHQTSCTDNFTTINITHALVTQADSENRHLACKVADHIAADSRFLRGAWPWGDADALRRHRLNLGESDLIITPHQRIGTELSEILDEVVGEGIVIIDDEDHDRKDD